MVNKKVYLWVAVVVVVVIAVVGVFASSGDTFLGKMMFLKRSTKSTSTPYIGKDVSKAKVSLSPVSNMMNVSVSVASPPSSRTVASSDSIAKFNLCSNELDVSVSKIGFDLVSSGNDLNPDAFIIPKLAPKVFVIKTKVDVDPIGVYEIKSSSSGKISLIYTFDNVLQVSRMTCEVIELVADSAAIVDEDAGEEDFFLVVLNGLYGPGGESVSSNTPVNGNMIKY